MTTATEAPVYALDDAKKCLTRILMDLASFVEPDTYECRDCTKAIESRCPDHADDAAASARLERAAAHARNAATRHDLWAAIVYAAPEEAERALAADLISINGGTK